MRFLLVIVLMAAFIYCGEQARQSAGARALLDDGGSLAGELPQPLGDGVKKEYAIEGIFIPSGWMGDAADKDCGGVLRFSESRDEPFDGPTCHQWSYNPRNGRVGWVAVAYQFPENNWGDKPGKDLRAGNYKRVTFAARGLMGGETIIFKSGGCTNWDSKFRASYDEQSIGAVRLTKTWKTYTIDLPRGVDLGNVVAPFVFATDFHLSPENTVFFVDGIKLTE